MIIFIRIIMIFSNMLGHLKTSHLNATCFQKSFCSVIWKPCVIRCLNIDSPDLEVSNTGQVRRASTLHVMKGFRYANGRYTGASVRHACGRRSNISVHRLVCGIYHGPPPSEEKCVVHHINHNYHDNRAVNLQWVSRKENAIFHRRAFPNKRQFVTVLKCTQDDTILKEFPSVQAAAESINVCPKRLSHAVSQGTQLQGFLWKRKTSNKVSILEGEEWRHIENYQHYEVSSFGRVKSCRRNIIMNPIGISPAVHINGKTLTVHRLVAQAFCHRTDGKDFVDHIDSNPQNNHFENLRWVDYVENRRNPITHNKICKPVEQYSKMSGSFIKRYDSITEASKLSGVTGQSISACCTKRRKSAGGFLWRFPDR